MRRIHTATASAGSAACHVRHLFYLLRVQHDGPAEQDTKPGTKSVAQGDREEIPATGCPIPNNPQWRPLPGDVRTGKGAVRIAQKENRKMGLGATETQLHRAEVHLGVLHGNGGGSGPEFPTLCLKLLATSATSSIHRNAGTPSRLLDMPQVKSKTL